MRLLFLATLIALSPAAFAQSNYHQGYIVKNNGDTLKGFIDYREWITSPRYVELKVNKEDKQPLRFRPADVRGFEIVGMETYISFAGMISMNRIDFEHLPMAPDTSKKQDTVFLRQVTTGARLTLYYHKDEVKTRYFVARAVGRPAELSYYEYYSDANQTRKSAIYQGQLILYINEFDPGNEKLIRKAESSNFEQRDIEGIVDAINNKGKAVKRKTFNRFFVGIGTNLTNAEIGNIDYEPSSMNHIATISPKVSLGLDMFGNPNVQKLIFRAELSFSYIDPKFKYPVTISGVNTNDSYQFNQYTASVTPQLLFNFYNKDKVKIYIDGGIAFNFSAYGNNKFISQSRYVNILSPITIPNPYKFEPYWVNFPLQVGVTLNKKIEFCLSYAGYVAYTKYPGFYASNQSMNIGVKFLVGKH